MKLSCCELTVSRLYSSKGSGNSSLSFLEAMGKLFDVMNNFFEQGSSGLTWSSQHSMMGLDC